MGYPAAQKPYAWLPLGDALARRIEPIVVQRGATEIIVGATDGRQADLLCIGRQKLMRWRRAGLTWEQADECAIRLGLHPAVIWPEWRADGLSVLDDEFVNRGGWRTAWEWDEQRRSA